MYQRRLAMAAIVLALSLAPMARVYALDRVSAAGDEARYQEIIARYKLKTVGAQALPRGLSPYRVYSPEELEAYIVGFLHPAEAQLAATAVSYGTVTRQCSTGVGVATFNTWADIQVALSGSFRWITSVLNTRTGLTGPTVGLSLHSQYSYPFNQTTTSVSFKGGGVVDSYVITQFGTIVLWSTAVSCTGSYSVY